MNKLIKLLNNHYIIVSDSEIKENQWYCNNKVLFLSDSKFDEGNNPNINKNNKLVTHSTQPLETKCCRCRYGSIFASLHPCKDECKHPPGLGYDKIKQLSLSEVEEVVNGYNYHTLAKETCIKYGIGIDFVHPYTLFIEGFKVHQEISKDKLFTIDDMRKAMWEIDRLKTTNLSTEEFKKIVDEYIESVLPKTEWDVEFDEQGKIKLI